jgi:hypothetical protein
MLTRVSPQQIYAGPSDMFKAYVDTPRSQSQFENLVICFPYSHKSRYIGNSLSYSNKTLQPLTMSVRGELVVRHNGQSVEFNWGGENPTAIKWAAFYSDCEHEVRQVTAGYRCTIT